MRTRISVALVTQVGTGDYLCATIGFKVGEICTC